jgi:hypothetical protein
MRHFCTYFDSNYLSRGLALYRSLQALGQPFQLWILCMDPACHEALARAELPGIRPIALEDFERGDEALLRAKGNRTLIEYYFTCTASLPRYVFREDGRIELLTYLDADLYFFADPEPLFEELGGGSVGIIEHRISKRLGSLEEYGRYNVGWISIRRDANGIACLEWWRDRCLEWCHDRVEPGRFAEQKYLDEWPRRFEGVVVLRHPGANVAPWNLADHPVRSEGDRLRVGASPLLFFHFHGFRHLGGRLYDPNLSKYRTKLSESARHHVYHPYIGALHEADREIAPYCGSVSLRTGVRGPLPAPFIQRAVKRIRRLGRFWIGLASGHYLLAPRSRASKRRVSSSASVPARS